MKRSKKQRPPKSKKGRRKAKLASPVSRTIAPPSPHIQQLINQALAHHQAGRLSEAEALYRQILNEDLKQYVALHLLGVIAYQVGNNEVAVDLISKAVAIKPDFAEAQYNLGNAQQGLGKLDDAVKSYVKATRAKPDYADAYINMGNVLKELGRLDEAIASHNKALSINPNFAEGHANLGNALQDKGETDQAIASYTKAIDINPRFAEAHINLGNALQDQGKLDEAVASYQRAIAINPDIADAHFNLGIAFREIGKADDAFTSQRLAVTLAPENPMFWDGFATALQDLSFTGIDETLLDQMLRLLEQPTVNPSHLVRPIISAVVNSPGFPKNLDAGIERQLSSVPLFLEILGLCPVNDLTIENMLTSLRKDLLDQVMAAEALDDTLPFAAALALHCFANEFVFNETEEEKSTLDLLMEQIENLLEQEQTVPAASVAALASYRALYRLDFAEKLIGRKWDSPIAQVIERQISEPLKEQALRGQISNLSPINNAVSQSVQQQYEENPYPRWIKTGIKGKGRSIGAELRRAPFRFSLTGYASPDYPDILVAGCGTGQQSLSTASNFSNARVLALDLSLSSLSYAMRKTEELGINNIEYAQADIMELGSLARQFDLIECVGVLHHLGDPIAGWRVLKDLLRPGGIMRIALYSETARQDVVAGRDLIAKKGYTPTPEDIRRCRQDIIDLAQKGDPAMADLRRRRDFFSLSECRDLLFHVQEHRFKLPAVEEALASLELEFLGFEMQDQNPMRAFKTAHPEQGALTSLALWHDFELQNPDTFRGMYRFWCQKR